MKFMIKLFERDLELCFNERERERGDNKPVYK